MQYQTDQELPPAVRLAHSVDRALTWGMAREERRRFLSEGLADWEAMASEEKPRRLVWRAARGIPAAVWARLDDRDVTSMPAGVALTVIGMAVLAGAVQLTTFPVPFRQSAMLAGVGLMLVGISFVRDPRRIVVNRYRLIAAAVAAGFGGLAITLPTAAEWPYEGPVLENLVVDTAIQAGFAVIAVAFALLVAVSFLPARHRLLTAAGVTLLVGVAALGMALTAWAILMAPVDLAATGASLVAGLAALSFAHVLPRLRHLEFVYSEHEHLGKGTK